MQLTDFERLQLAATLLPKQEISQLFLRVCADNEKKADIDKLYARYVEEMFKIASLIEKKAHSLVPSQGE